MVPLRFTQFFAPLGSAKPSYCRKPLSSKPIKQRQEETKLNSKYSVLDFAEDVLNQVDSPKLYQEIWDIGKETSFATKLKLTGKTPWATIGARLFVDVRDNENTRFIKVGKNPARFFLKSRSNELTEQTVKEILTEDQSKPSNQLKTYYSERNLHPLASYFAYTNTDFNKGKAIFTKTIFHEKSRKSGFNEWVHPDMVGFYIPIEDWNQKLLEFNNISDSNSIKIYSFELKKRIDKSNYRECYFQAVSNSSWSNEGYLVTAEIKEDDDLYTELERLSSSFGIGIIKLDIEDIDSSKVMFPAKAKAFLDWETMNKLCEQNSDFESFIDDITKDYKVKTIHKNQYDKVIEEPFEYIEKLKKESRANT
jgi:hypothetical protein